MIFPRVETAAPDICCKRARECRNAVRRAFMYAFSNVASLSHLISVLADTGHAGGILDTGIGE
jgi:hypothetical protein